MKMDFKIADADAADTRLDELAPGTVGVIASVENDDPVGHRLLDLGLIPGTEIRAIRHAPLGDPAVFELRGYQLCLRRSESRRVRVTRP